MEDWRDGTYTGIWGGRHLISSSCDSLPSLFLKVLTTIALWNHVGDAIFASTTDGAVRILSYPDVEVQGRAGAHPRACYALALDPRGK